MLADSPFSLSQKVDTATAATENVASEYSKDVFLQHCTNHNEPPSPRFLNMYGQPNNIISGRLAPRARGNARVRKHALICACAYPGTQACKDDTAQFSCPRSKPARAGRRAEPGEFAGGDSQCIECSGPAMGPAIQQHCYGYQSAGWRIGAARLLRRSKLSAIRFRL